MEETYAAAWRGLRRLRRIRFYAVVAFICGPFVMIPALELLLRFASIPTVLREAPVVVEVAFALTAGFCEWSLYKWECPRCGHVFGRLHEECKKCGLPLWSNETESREGLKD